MKLRAKKFDSGKPRMELIPGKALIQVARVLSAGAKRYGDWNWRLGLSPARCCGAARRHITAFLEGEDLDEEGTPHLAHGICELMFALVCYEEHPELDDRFRSTRKVAYKATRGAKEVRKKRRRS